jgi:hypothetical protein
MADVIPFGCDILKCECRVIKDQNDITAEWQIFDLFSKFIPQISIYAKNKSKCLVVSHPIGLLLGSATVQIWLVDHFKAIDQRGWTVVDPSGRWSLWINHVPSSKFNRLNHTVDLLLSRNWREVS